jgi:hypothetical protein
MPTPLNKQRSAARRRVRDPRVAAQHDVVHPRHQVMAGLHICRACRYRSGQVLNR